MSLKRLVPLNTVSLSADPQTARTGDIYFNSIQNRLRVFNGQSWEYLGVSSYNDLSDKPSIISSAVQWTPYHNQIDGSGTNTRYLAGDVVWDNGSIFIANYDNESLPTSNTQYWTNLGSGNRLNIDGRDIPNITYNQLVGKPDLSIYATTSYVDDAISNIPGGSGALRVEQVNSSGVIESYYPITTLQFDEDSGFDVINTVSGKAKITMNSTFKYWQVNGIQALTAEGLDTLNVTSGDGIIISASDITNPKSINFSIDSSKVALLDQSGNIPLSQLGNIPVKSTVSILSSAPSSPSNGDLWMKSDTGSLYVYDGQFWAETSGGGGFGVSISNIAPSNPSTGALWVDSSTGITYTYDGMYWFEM